MKKRVIVLPLLLSMAVAFGMEHPQLPKPDFSSLRNRESSSSNNPIELQELLDSVRELRTLRTAIHGGTETNITPADFNNRCDPVILRARRLQYSKIAHDVFTMKFPQ
jgi:hypothetical protein